MKRQTVLSDLFIKQKKTKESVSDSLSAGLSSTTVQQNTGNSCSPSFEKASTSGDLRKSVLICSEKTDPLHSDGDIVDVFSTSMNLIGGCIKLQQFEKWKSSRPWLSYKASGEIICSFCSDVQKHGALKDSKLHIETAFIKGMKAKNNKKLNDKISDHGRGKFHLKCAEILEERNNEKLPIALATEFRLWEEKNEEKIEVTARNFRTAYLTSKRGEPFKLYTDLCKLQYLNGTNVGQMLHSDHSCANMINFISNKMSKALAQHLIESGCVFSILIDESTTISNKSSLILYIRCMFDGEPCNYFFDIIELTSLTGEAIAESISFCFNKHGVTDEILRTQLIGFASDGAANLQGAYRGVVTFLKSRYNQDLIVIHCLNHKLELAVHDVINSMSVSLHFKSFVDSLYGIFSVSPKKQREIEEVATTLGCEFRKIGKMFDIRWVASSCSTVKAVMTSYTSLVQFLKNNKCDGCLNPKNKAKYQGLLEKLTTWSFVVELALFRDTLEILKQLSLYFQSQNSDAISVSSEISVCINSLHAMKEAEGIYLKVANAEYLKTGKYQGQDIKEPSNKNKETFDSFRRQFLQGLVDNLSARFSSANHFFKDCEVLNQAWWPKSCSELLLFGDDRIKSLCDSVKIYDKSDEDSIVSKTIKEFRLFKELKNQEFLGNSIKELFNRIKVVPVSSAECERGFSIMNNTLTKLRNRMHIETLSSLMFISVNGPALEDFPAKRFAADWIKEGHHSATDIPHRRETSKTSSHASKLFV